MEKQAQDKKSFTVYYILSAWRSGLSLLGTRILNEKKKVINDYYSRNKKLTPNIILKKYPIISSFCVIESHPVYLHNLNNCIGERVWKMPGFPKSIGAHKVHSVDMALTFFSSSSSHLGLKIQSNVKLSKCCIVS